MACIVTAAKCSGGHTESPDGPQSFDSISSPAFANARSSTALPCNVAKACSIYKSGVDLRTHMGVDMCTDMRGDVCIERCIETCIDMSVASYVHRHRVDMFIDRCMHMRIDMCVNLCVDMRVDMRFESCTDTGMDMHMAMRMACV